MIKGKSVTNWSILSKAQIRVSEICRSSGHDSGIQAVMLNRLDLITY